MANVQVHCVLPKDKNREKESESEQNKIENLAAVILTNMVNDTSDSFFEGYEEARAVSGSEKLISHYNQKAKCYEKSVTEVGFRETQQYGANTLKDYLLQNNKDRNVEVFEVLDLGCGSGLTGVSLNQSGFKLIDGVDPAKGMREVAAKHKGG